MERGNLLLPICSHSVAKREPRKEARWPKDKYLPKYQESMYICKNKTKEARTSGLQKERLHHVQENGYLRLFKCKARLLPAVDSDLIEERCYDTNCLWGDLFLTETTHIFCLGSSTTTRSTNRPLEYYNVYELDPTGQRCRVDTRKHHHQSTELPRLLAMIHKPL